MHRLTWLLLLLVACGQVDPVLMPVSMPECIYQGPSSMREGDARVSLTFNGIGESGVALVELAGEGRFDELTAHFEADPRWSERPSWVSPVVELRLDSGGEGVQETVALSAGSYAVVCIEYMEGDANGRSRTAARIEVTGP